MGKAGGEANGADNEQGVVQYEHGGKRRKARTVPRHGDALNEQAQGVHLVNHILTRNIPVRGWRVQLRVFD